MIRGMTAPSFMDSAFKTAQNASKSRRVPIGCVIVRGYEVIPTAGNRKLIDHDPTATPDPRDPAGGRGHRHRRLVDCDLDVTVALHDVRGRDFIARSAGSITAPPYRRAARWIPACGSLPSRPATTCRRSTVVGETEAATLLKEFFRVRR